MRIVYLGSPAAAIAPLAFLHAKAESLGCQLVAVVSQPAKPQGRKKDLIDTPVAQYAKDHGLDLLTPEKASADEFLAQFTALKPDLAVTAAYGQILSDRFLAIPKRATINIHPSLLPKYRGATPVPAALLDGAARTGVTILFTVKKLDAGNLIAHKAVEIDPDETAKTLTERLFILGGELLPAVIEKLRNSHFTGEPQSEGLVTLCKKIHKEDGLVRFDTDAASVYNRFRAHSPWPGSFCFVEGKRLNVIEMRLHGENSPTLAIGEAVFSKADKAILVGTKAGTLKLLSLQPAGSSVMPAAAFWNGLKNKNSVMFKDV